MVRPVSKIVKQLEGEMITCPLCRSEEVELKTTKSDSLQGFCAIQRSPFFLNQPRRLDSELLPDELTDEDKTDLEQSDQQNPDWLEAE